VHASKKWARADRWSLVFVGIYPTLHPAKTTTPSTQPRPQATTTTIQHPFKTHISHNNNHHHHHRPNRSSNIITIIGSNKASNIDSNTTENNTTIINSSINIYLNTNDASAIINHHQSKSNLLHLPNSSSSSNTITTIDTNTNTTPNTIKATPSLTLTATPPPP
jgi:hypothetical protein